jgi:hypothetical protein
MTAPQIVFLPGFDGVRELRASSSRRWRRTTGARDRLSHSRSARLQRLRATAAQADARVAARCWSPNRSRDWCRALGAQDPRVRAVVLCGAFARTPVARPRLGASLPALVKFVGAVSLQSHASRGDAGRAGAGPTRFRGAAPAPGRVARAPAPHRHRGRERRAARARSPVCWCHFDGDLVIGSGRARHARGGLSQCRVVRVPGPHFAHRDAPAECAAAMRRGISGRSRLARTDDLPRLAQPAPRELLRRSASSSSRCCSAKGPRQDVRHRRGGAPDEQPDDYVRRVRASRRRGMAAGGDAPRPAAQARARRRHDRALAGEILGKPADRADAERI